MTKQTRGSNRNGRKGDPNQDVQPWLGWIAAMLVVVIVVVAVALGINRGDNPGNGAAEVRMTPLVGGMEVPVATETGEANAESEVTPVPAAISETATISMVTVITATDAMTATDTFTATGEMTPTVAMTMTEPLTVTETMSVTETMTPSAEITATAEVTGTEAVTAEATTEPTAVPTPRPTATARPTTAPNLELRSFEAGDLVVASSGRVEIYADASLEALVLDSFGPGVALEVLDPSGDYEGYPVEADGHGWARVRATDGLVGWVMTDQVEAQ
jgi:hypothetical protein